MSPIRPFCFTTSLNLTILKALSECYEVKLRTITRVEHERDHVKLHNALIYIRISLNITFMSILNINGKYVMTDLNQLIASAVKESGADDSIKSQLTESLKKELSGYVNLELLKTKLEVLYNFEKNYLELVKEYKEEIKFASTLQEDLRKERSKFFSETLKEVSHTLSESQVDGDVASKWLKELVDSYTKSLDLSSSLIEEHTLDTIGKIRAEAKLNKPSVASSDNH